MIFYIQDNTQEDLYKSHSYVNDNNVACCLLYTVVTIIKGKKFKKTLYLKMYKKNLDMRYDIPVKLKIEMRKK